MGKSVKFSDRFFMENFTLDLKKQQFLKGRGKRPLRSRLEDRYRSRSTSLEAKAK